LFLHILKLILPFWLCTLLTGQEGLVISSLHRVFMCKEDNSAMLW